jgi:hypothetical protein
MNPMVIKGLKILVGVASLALPVASNYFDKKDQAELIAKEVAKQLAEKMGES